MNEKIKDFIENSKKVNYLINTVFLLVLKRDRDYRVQNLHHQNAQG
jgi:hypothetical protein